MVRRSLRFADWGHSWRPHGGGVLVGQGNDTRHGLSSPRRGPGRAQGRVYAAPTPA